MATDIHAQGHVSNVKVMFSMCNDMKLQLESTNWQKKLCQNEIKSAVIWPDGASIELTNPVNGINPRSNAARQYLMISFDSNLCDVWYNLLDSVTSVHDFRQFEKVFISWGYNTKLYAKRLHSDQSQFALVYSDKYRCFSTGDLEEISLNRAGGGARTFDVTFNVNGGNFELENIDNSLYASLVDTLGAEGNLRESSDEDEMSEEEWQEGETDDTESESISEASESDELHSYEDTSEDESVASSGEASDEDTTSDDA